MSLSKEKALMYPIAERILHQTKIGAVDDTRGEGTMNPPITLDDYYHWLRDDKRKDPKVLNYLEEENKYTECMMSKIGADEIKEDLYKELLSHIQETYDSYPLPNNDNGWDSEYYYFTRTIKGKSYPIHCRINIDSQKVEKLLDENEIAQGKTCCDITSFTVTKDHKYMSYGIDTTGNEKYDLKIVDIETKVELDHVIPPLTYCDYTWHENFIYYSVGDHANRMYQIWRYNILSKENAVIYQNLDELVNVNFYFSNDNKYIFINADSYETSDCYYLKHGELKPKQFTIKVPEHKYSVDYHEGNFLIKTNIDESVNFKVMICPEDNTSRENWKDLIEYHDEYYIKSILELKNYILVSFKNEGHNLVKVIPYVNKEYDLENSYEIEVEDSIKNVFIHCAPQYDSDQILFSQNSLKTPHSIYNLDLSSGSQEFIRMKPVPNYDSELYNTERLYATSFDNEQVPISIVYRKDKFNKDGTNKLYLYGYGSYGHTVNPTFSSTILPLLDRGFVYAIAHVRGSSFLGYDWYMDGKMENKINTFHDFNACAEYLIQENYTFDTGITIEGRSAGGLLVGAAMTMRPELYRTVIAGVPFVDVINTMSDPTIPLTVPEWEQWGNPNIEKYYHLMMEYSPYDNINPNNYPNVLALAGLNDPRVAYWEPAKFVAKLRYHNAGNNQIILKTELEQGHFGGMDRYKYLKEKAFSYAFIIKTYQED